MDDTPSLKSRIPREPRWLASLGLGGALVALVVGTLVAYAAPEPASEDGERVAAIETSAIIRADGDCLRLRATPGLAGERLTCLADGSTVSLLGTRVEVDGLAWELVQAGDATGFVAADFLELAPPEPVISEAVEPPTEFELIAGPLPVPVPGGLTQGLAGASDPATLVAVQPFEVESAFVFVPSEQRFLRYIPGAPKRVNTLSAEHLSPSSIVTLRRRGSSPDSALASTPVAA